MFSPKRLSHVAKEDFVRAIRTGQSPRVSGEVGLEVVRVLAEIQDIRVRQEVARALRV